VAPVAIQRIGIEVVIDVRQIAERVQTRQAPLAGRGRNGRGRSGGAAAAAAGAAAGRARGRGGAQVQRQRHAARAAPAAAQRRLERSLEPSVRHQYRLLQKVAPIEVDGIGSIFKEWIGECSR